MSSLSAFDSRLADVAGVSVVASTELVGGEGPGLQIVVIENALGRATLTLQGAHVLSFTPAGGRDLLWVSPLAIYKPGKAVRGGIPLCLPWFGSHPDGLPAHGFARTALWSIVGAEALTDGRTKVVFALTDSEATLKLWAHAFRFEFAVIVGKALDVELVAEHKGDVPVKFTAALHSYFSVPNVADAVINGLEGCPRIDTVGGITRSVNEGAVHIVGTHDSVYLDVPAEQTIVTSAGTTHVYSADTRSAVVWNPGEQALDIGDLKEHYPGFVCVERGDVYDNAIELAPGASYRATMTISG
ncbi:glucose-6-phosphate 1-epimerase [Andreprevotia lacus DSM 23236]|jgi:D-hexose-6-phosphate mutarotase|uniref:Putative glucose-6-phosphate 1-epimerase n=1 Tax=Andreprevotia lacus DSM 23236 TaxID=1121001 RepID=A0A1W1XE59_9NEIS|nr:D-hexose-6-phosphate mutarotase [Andreprevotia lacus]SMC22226.1 glucose-6-phosphate 1-epimerase [Andreprevotia lacus DSM 23236]